MTLMLGHTYRALREVPQRMSLTAEELKVRAQPLTNTDLEDKQGGQHTIIHMCYVWHLHNENSVLKDERFL